jgi:hypothetical protein
VPTVSYTGSVAPASFSSTTTDKAAVAGLAWGASGMLDGMSTMGLAMGSMPTGAIVPQAPMGVKDVLRLAADAFHRPGAASAAGVVSNRTPCPAGGTRTDSVYQQNANPAITTNGDYVELAFAACNQGQGLVMDGSLRLTVDQTAGDDFVMDARSITTDRAFVLTIAFNNFVTVDTNGGGWSGVDGDIGVSLAVSAANGTITAGISGTEFVEAVGFEGAVFGMRLAALPGQPKYHDTAVETYTGMGTINATLVSSSGDLDARLCTTQLNGCVDIETNPVMVVAPPNQYPNAGGALTVSAGADWVKATAVNPTTGACTVSWSIGGSTGSLDTYWDSL